MTETMIYIDELADKILRNAMIGSPLERKGDTERFGAYNAMRSHSLVNHLIRNLGRPLVYTSKESYDSRSLWDTEDDDIDSVGEDNWKKEFENRVKGSLHTNYRLLWAPKEGFEIGYDDHETSIPRRFRMPFIAGKSDVPYFERVTIHKKWGLKNERNVSFEYFFENDEREDILCDANTSIDLSENKHHRFFPKYYGLLDKLKPGFNERKPAYKQGLRLRRVDLVKEIRKLLVSEGVFHPIMR